jgi:hypothetical protein
MPFAQAGDNAAAYWARRQVETGNPIYAVPGILASLWTTDTAIDTALALAPVTVARPIGMLANSIGTSAADYMLESRLLGPSGPVFGNKFYAGKQGVLNYGTVRFGWSFNAKTRLLEFTFRVGDWHAPPIFVRPPPPGP